MKEIGIPNIFPQAMLGQQPISEHGGIAETEVKTLPCDGVNLMHGIPDEDHPLMDHAFSLN